MRTLRLARGWWGLAVLAALAALMMVPPGAVAKTRFRARGALDCNGFSTAQKSIKPTGVCTDVRGFPGDTAFNQDNRFYDNGHYIGHDEPDMTFLSNAPGSGNDVSWTETLPMDPAAAPTVNTPGSDVSHWFELSVAPWFSMALCNSESYPLTPCNPNSDSNAPRDGAFPGGGSSFLEMQFYPPGFAPFVDSISCDNKHWCASLHINDLECTLGFAQCNNNCIEPTNFAFIQRNGVPTGPPSPQRMNLASNTPNSDTLLMNPGDRLKIHIFDAPVPGQPGHMALKTTIDDLTTGQSGFMQASAKNGYMATSIADCSGTPFDYQPEYNTAKKDNIVPWAALQTNISTQFELGHFEACSSISDRFRIGLAPGLTDDTWNRCHGPYEDSTTPDSSPENPEPGDAPCYPKGDTHGALHAAPDTVTGCAVFFTAPGDVDFNGSPYWPEWPVAATPTSLYPGSFVQALPSTKGRAYPQYFIQTDLALSESTCSANPGGSGCAVPPPNAPGKFYPYWTRAGSGPACKIEFGNVASGNTNGGEAQYGTDQFSRIGYDEFEGPVRNNSNC